MSVVPRFRLGLDDLVHVVAVVTERDGTIEHWTPACDPDAGWIVLVASDVPGPPTCLACAVCDYTPQPTLDMVFSKLSSPTCVEYTDQHGDRFRLTSWSRQIGPEEYERKQVRERIK